MLSSVARFLSDESGLETVEWAIVGGVIAVAVVALFSAIGLDALRGMTSLDTETSLIP